MARYLLEASPVPLHHQVYLDLRAALDEGDWKPGDRIPTERELASRYGVSVITVRHALGDLTRERRLERARGKGTFVTPPPVELDLGGTTSFMEEIRRHGRQGQTTVVESETRAADPHVAGALRLDAGDAVHYLERLRLADRVALLLEQAFLPAARFPRLLDHDFARDSLYETLQRAYATRVTRAREAIEPVLLLPREARLLGQPTERPALFVEGIAFDEAGRPVEFSRSYVRGDRTRFFVERTVVRDRQRPAVGLTPPDASLGIDPGGGAPG